jgi:hypothetical protein
MKAIAGIILGLSFIAFLACKKTVPPPKIVVTPLQTLLNTDTTLSLFHLMVLEANDAGLLNDTSASLFIPRNAVLRQAGYTDIIIDSMSSSLADQMIRYQYLPGPVNTDSAGYTPNPTYLGIPLFIEKDSTTLLVLNGSASAGASPTQVGKASVYWLNSLVPPASDSLSYLLQQDSTLSLFAEILGMTNVYDSLLLSGNYTLLAPDNNALLLAGYDSLNIADSANIDTLIQLAVNQVIQGSWFTNNFPATVTGLQGGSITVSQSGGMLQFIGSGNPAPVNWLGGNEVAGPHIIVHKTDGVLSP